MDNKLVKQLQDLNRLYKESDHLYSSLASHFGLSETTFWVLYAISHSEEPLTQNDLCNDYFFPVQTINSAIGSLLKKEIIELEFIPGTRNRKKIILTEKGKQIANETINKVDEIEKNAFLMFTEKEREIYLDLFKRHIESLKKEEQKILNAIKEEKESWSNRELKQP